MQVPGRWSVVARDAFNGVLLWKRPLSSWAWEQHGFRAGPVQLPRLEIPLPYTPIFATSYNPPSTGTESNRAHRTGVAPQCMLQTICSHIPQQHIIVRVDGHQIAARRDRQAARSLCRKQV